MTQSFDENEFASITPNDETINGVMEGESENSGELNENSLERNKSISGNYEEFIGLLKTVTENSSLPQNFNVGDKYMEFFIPDGKSGRVLVDLNELKDIYTAGNGISILNNVISNTKTVNWGEIKGLLSNQQDLQNALNAISEDMDYSNYVPKTQIATVSQNGIVNIDTINQSKGLETGMVSDDKDVLADIKKYAHSTFDISKFTLVGNPSVTEDGIAGEFSTSKYIKLPTIDINGQDFEFCIKLKTPSASFTQDIFGSSTLNHRFVLGWSSQKKFYVSVNGDFGFPILYTAANVEYDTEYYVKTGVKGNKYFLSYSLDGINWKYIERTVTNQFTNLTNMVIGNRNTNNPFYGEVDLKYFSISVNNVEVFSGNKTGTDTYIVNGENLIIPYSWSKTGSKIVDSQYRDRVNDMYEQFGYAPYYTLSDNDFTLPMGEIYGMINQNSEKLQELGSDVSTLESNFGIFESNANASEEQKIGVPVFTLSDTLLSDEIWLEGAEVSKTTYNKLFAIYGNDYGIPENSANFVLPDFRDRVIQGIASDASFGYIEAGLPNITASTQFNLISNGNIGNYTNGALSEKLTAGNIQWRDSGFCLDSLHFNASNSSQIYGNSTTVQPPAIKVRVKTKYK